MKRKYIIILAATILVCSASLAAYSNRHMFFPSPQIKSLRQLEARLDLPKPTHRNQVDQGYNKDFKGASHYDRHIALSYQDKSVLNIVRTKLLQDSWQEQPKDAIGTNQYFSFSKGTGDTVQCVTGYTKPKDSSDLTLYILLSSSGEYSCNPAPGL